MALAKPKNEEPEFLNQRAEAQFARAKMLAGSGGYEASVGVLRTAFRREGMCRHMTKVLGLNSVWSIMTVYADQALSPTLHAHLVTFNAVAVREMGRHGLRQRYPLSQRIESGFERKLLRLVRQQRALGRAESLVEYLCDRSADRINETALAELQRALRCDH